MNIYKDPEIHYWCVEASTRGGGFVKSLACTALHADSDNYAILRPALLQFVEKYPGYSDKEKA